MKNDPEAKNKWCIKIKGKEVEFFDSYEKAYDRAISWYGSRQDGICVDDLLIEEITDKPKIRYETIKIFPV